MFRARAALLPPLGPVVCLLGVILGVLLTASSGRAQTGPGGSSGSASTGSGSDAAAPPAELPSLEPLGQGFPTPAEPAPAEPPPEPPPPAVAPAPGSATAPAATPTSATAASPAAQGQPASDAPPTALPATDDLRARRSAVVEFEAGRGFELRTSDGDFALALGAGLQTLYTAVLPYVGENRQYLEVRRARLRFAGNLFGAHNRFFIQLALSPRDLGRKPVALNGVEPATDPTTGEPESATTAEDVITRSPLLDAWVHFDHLRDLNFQVGQFRVPFSRQRVMPFPSMHFADRSIANREFGLDRDIGFMVFSRNFLGLDRLRYAAGLFIGEGRDSSSQTLGAGDQGFSYVVRAEVTPFGAFDDDYSDTDFLHRSAPSLSLGVGYALVQGDAISPMARDNLGMVYETPGEEPIVDYNAHNLTVDAMFKVAGLSLQSAFHYRQVGPIPNARDGLGFMADAGYLLPPIPLEILGAFSMTRKVGSSSSLDPQNELGGGFAYYFFEQFLKVQIDLFHLWEPDAFARGDERIRVQFYAGF